MVEELLAPSDATTIPGYLRELPDRVVNVAPVEPRIQELPFDKLSWQNFERLVFRLARGNSDVVYCARYGRPGQAQDGIDIYARLSGGGHNCWQARNRKYVDASDIERAVEDFLKGKWAATAERFVLCFRASLADTGVQDAIEAGAARLDDKGIVFEGVDGIQLSERVRSQPEIVDDFFGRQWLVAFAGRDVAESLKRPLEVQRVVALRTRLAEIYHARINQLDPDLNVVPGRRDTRDIRKRFVVPNVDPANVFVETSLEPDESTDEAATIDEHDWQFDEYGHPDRSADIRREPSESSEFPSVALDDWLLQDERALLLSGAPGSGKSTALRCLALDLVRTPELFPAVNDRLGGCIPFLIPFALWSRLAAKADREVGLAEVIQETFRAYFPEGKLEDSFIEALSDERLVLLIDGLDEYSDEQAARTTLVTIETLIRTHDVFTVATARPAGLRRLGPVSGYWKTARLVELLPRQQRELATKLLSEQVGVAAPVAVRVEQFFQQLEHRGHLQSLAGNPLLLHGMLWVAARRVILPNTRFQLFQKLIEILLEVHPNRRATAAAEMSPRTRVFLTDDVRVDALAKLAFEVQVRGADAGIDRGDARQVIEGYLADTQTGQAWSTEKARLGARELTDIDADTSGLLVERGPEELGFCHAAFREHLAGLELATWELNDQVEFVSGHAADPRWRGTILVLLQSQTRRSDVERILKAIRDEQEDAPDSTDLRLLLAEGAFATASLAGEVGRRTALDSLDRIEQGTDDVEGLELLGLALDGPRAGPIGEAIVARLSRWWPGHTELQRNLYVQLGRWDPTESLARTLQLALLGDRNQLAAAASLAKVFEGRRKLGDWLTTLVHESQNPWVTAAALDALSRGWPSIDGLDGWLNEAGQSSSIQMRVVAALALYRRGRRGDEGRDALLHALGVGWNRFSDDMQWEIVDALVTDWPDDGELLDACWEGVGSRSPRKYNIGYDFARFMLMRLHREDARVPRWVEQEIKSRDYFPFKGTRRGGALLEAILSEHANVRSAVENWFEGKKYSSYDYEAAQLAVMLKSEVAKQSMISGLSQSGRFRFWPVWSLLHGWGTDDAEVAAALKPLPRIPPEERQYIAHHIPAIVGSADESIRLLLEICDLPEVSRTDFVIRGFAALGNVIDEEKAVSSVLPHVRKSPAMFGGERSLIVQFHTDTRVREFALARLLERSPPLAAIASVYSNDREIASLILQRAAPLPTVFRRHIARRASQRFDDAALKRVLHECAQETDSHAMMQATIGLSYAVLANPDEANARTESLRRQLHAVGPDYSERQVAAFGGLLALGRTDIFAGERERRDDEPLEISIVEQFKDYSPVLELAAERWEELERVVGKSLVSRLSRWNEDPNGFWQSFAPYLSRSPSLRTKFLEYCEGESVVLEAPSLVALSRLGPGSSLLLDCCKRVLTAELDEQKWSPLDVAQSTVIASKCLARYFSEDSNAVNAIIAASDSLRAQGGALVGLASNWPDQDIVVREYRNLLDRRRWPELLVCAELWVLTAQGTREQVANALAWFVTRRSSSPWDFPEDALGAFRARLERDPDVGETLRQFAVDVDEPSVRASTVRLLASMSTNKSQDFAEEMLAAESRRPGPPRFALDILTNRIRPARDLMSEALN